MIQIVSSRNWNHSLKQIIRVCGNLKISWIDQILPSPFEKFGWIDVTDEIKTTFKNNFIFKFFCFLNVLIFWDISSGFYRFLYYSYSRVTLNEFLKNISIPCSSTFIWIIFVEHWKTLYYRAIHTAKVHVWSELINISFWFMIIP